MQSSPQNTAFNLFNMEEWRDIPGFEGLYQVSNLGRVKSFYFGKERILKHKIDKGGYLITVLSKGKKRDFKSHRLVAQAFLGLDINDSKMCVCHKDDNPSNNCVDNLFLGTQKENLQDCAKKGRTSNKGKFGILHHGAKKVNQYTKEGEFIKSWDCIIDITRELGIRNSSISAVCRGIKYKKTAGGFIWKYKKYTSSSMSNTYSMVAR